ncbi:bifunctional UDP-N-acetylglucosamine diphosphorylase/glucosamine-1-phosphate N-acetyltransferase GlmU [Candidatus Venteria ishoeyi]|uniref:bifunctional UDP-N-acetylglucosamine diphosphorylase/glucosamine-1-phosphate N-acetyltransferase GlmU n=1 Tax=Candidatus Venteria ishoeyi TaxID=1899563 RepID=UPI0025A5044D|nr:bifunctional UDP-N-acetylglucosamine diphosphorylase/glucosamine-1-phosphate N-acetyltransferase GlmU [Candidatus Venteria ishoeyi]MDM8547161.1 bifunctional UDP-N-acetylglucosamine diphosphorylase/glucosamine-1-phosphate N-acetyltransferase GlmU [Candidatus Venteria ishoeyi]
MKLSIIILAAGQGTRMRSSLPKVLHPLAGRPLLHHVLETAEQLNPETIYVVYGHGGEHVCDSVQEKNIQMVAQMQQLGTGHAVDQVMPSIPDDHQVLVLYGDVPLTRMETLQAMTTEAGQNLSLLTVMLDDPSGYGRIVRNQQQQVQAIVEQKDADTQTLKIKEANTGMLRAPAQQLRQWLQQLENNNAQQEYYLTDIIAMAVADGCDINTLQPQQIEEVQGVNNRQQLAELERFYQYQQAEQLMLAGVTLLDPARFDLRGQVKTGLDVSIDINVVLEGQVTLGDRVQIGANSVIKNAVIGDDVIILPNCVIEDAVIENQCQIGPFSRIRPDTHLAAQVKVGNFVEIKKSQVASGSKISHLSYIGDTEMGKDVNIGAGTITCNYDGANKYKTIIGDRAFIGSDTQLVAPVTVGAGATIGAGSTITHDAPAETLSLSRSPQKFREGWQRPVKKK